MYLSVRDHIIQRAIHSRRLFTLSLARYTSQQGSLPRGPGLDLAGVGGRRAIRNGGLKGELGNSTAEAGYIGVVYKSVGLMI